MLVETGWRTEQVFKDPKGKDPEKGPLETTRTLMSTSGISKLLRSTSRLPRGNQIVIFIADGSLLLDATSRLQTCFGTYLCGLAGAHGWSNPGPTQYFYKMGVLGLGAVAVRIFRVPSWNINFQDACRSSPLI